MTVTCCCRWRLCKGGSITVTVDLLFDWFGLVCFANKNKNCQLFIQLIPNQSNRRSMVQWYLPLKYSLVTLTNITNVNYPLRLEYNGDNLLAKMLATAADVSLALAGWLNTDRMDHFNLCQGGQLYGAFPISKDSLVTPSLTKKLYGLISGQLKKKTIRSKNSCLKFEL